MKTLHRPMFRRGGSTGEGITSGLAPRQGYAHPHGKVEQVRRPRTNLNNFLIDFGLDLVSRPPSGGIFATAASAAKDPFARFQARDVARDEREWERKLHAEEMGFKEKEYQEGVRQFGMEHAQDLVIANIESKGKDEFKREQIDQYWDKKIADAPPSEHEDIEANRQKDIYDIVIQGGDISDKYKILSNESATFMAQGLAEDAIKKETNPATNKKWITDDDGYEEFLLRLFNKYLRIVSEFMVEEEKATGGRVGRALGGEMTEDINVETETPRGISDINVSETVERDPGPTNEINISYEQLRDRLPQEISNEIVLLLSKSYEAFADFAEIQTQADVNEFNTKYNVQLSLPQQSGV